MTGGQTQLHCLSNGHEMNNQNVPDIYTYERLQKHAATPSLKYELFLCTLLKCLDLKSGKSGQSSLLYEIKEACPKHLLSVHPSQERYCI